MGLYQNAIDAPREQKRMETHLEFAEGDTVQIAALYIRRRATSADLRQLDADEIQERRYAVFHLVSHVFQPDIYRFTGAVVPTGNRKSRTS